MIIRMIIAFFVLLVVSFNAVAGELYTCKILNVCELAGYGSLKHSDLEKQFKDSEFIISRATGDIIEVVVPTLLPGSTKIVIKGNDENPFRSVAEIRDGVQVIEIDESVPDEEKPFIAVTIGGAEIVTGLCK